VPPSGTLRQAPSKPVYSWSDRLSQRTLALLVFLIVILPSGWSVLFRRQLGSMGGMADEWHYLGANLAWNSILGIGEDPVVFRPPAYPFFVAAVLRLGSARPVQISGEYLARTEQLLYLAHCLVLGCAAVIAYSWFTRFMGRAVAFTAATLLGTNAYSVVLVGLARYDVVYIASLLAILLALSRLFAAPLARARQAWVTGLVIGAATLVKPLTLLLPPFVLLALGLRGRSWRAAVGTGLLLCAGMALVIAPWTWRNYSVSGRLIPVNAQMWSAIWGSTVQPLRPAPDHYQWIELGGPLRQIYIRATGEQDFDIGVWLRKNDALEAEFKRAALANLRLRPVIYVGNVLRSLYTLAAHLNTIQVAAFQELQSGGHFDPWRFGRGHPRPLRHSAASRAFGAWTASLTAAAWLGGVLALWRRDTALLPVAVLWPCLWIGHSVTYMDIQYYSLKIPFLFACAFYLVGRLPGWTLRVPWTSRRPSLRGVVSVALAVSGFGLTLWVLAAG